MTYPTSGETPEPGHTHCKTSPSSSKDPSSVASQVHDTLWFVAIYAHVSIKGIVAAAEQLLLVCTCRIGTDSHAMLILYLRLSQAMISTEAAFSWKHLLSESDPMV